MIHEAVDTLVVKRGEQLAAPRRITRERSPSITTGSGVADRALSVSELVKQFQQEIQAYRRGGPSNEIYSLELLRYAIVQGDQYAWAGLQLCLGGIVRGWLHSHPSREAACRWESEETYVALAFERFWLATIKQQMIFKTLAGALAYLRTSLHGAILDTLRTYSRSREVQLPLPGGPWEPWIEEHTESSEAWEILLTMLPSRREQQLAYLLYYCGLKPREIVHFCSQEWSDVREIYRLRRIIIGRLQRNANQVRWLLN